MPSLDGAGKVPRSVPAAQLPAYGAPFAEGGRTVVGAMPEAFADKFLYSRLEPGDKDFLFAVGQLNRPRVVS